MNQSNNMDVKYIDPVERMIQFVKALDIFQHNAGSYSMNISIRGQFISIYLPADPMCELINALARDGYHDHGNARYFAEQNGYSKTDFYCNIGPYMVRVALHREKITNNHDIKWLDEQYKGKIASLTREVETYKKVTASLSDENERLRLYTGL